MTNATIHVHALGDAISMLKMIAATISLSDPDDLFATDCVSQDLSTFIHRNERFNTQQHQSARASLSGTESATARAADSKQKMPTQKPAPRVRQATHAGSWYSHEEQALDTELTEWLRSASESNAHGEHQTIRAIIAPHAGFRYSGPTAAHAYHHLEALDRVKRVFILGPSHHFYLRGCAVSTAVEYETPLGNIEIDNEINEQLINTGKFVTMSLDVDEDEHSIEMHLPFIFKVMNGRKFTAVPILVGNTKTKMDQEYGKILAPYLEDEENLFVISSDFCHWGSRFRYQPHDSAYGEIHEYIKYLDHEGMKLIERIDATGFAEYLEKTKNTICGRHPISLLLHSIRVSDKIRCTLKFVQYAQSSACKHHGDSSVSYASAIVYHNP